MEQNTGKGNVRISRIRERRQAKDAKKKEPIRLQSINTHDQATENYLERSRRKGKKFNARWVSGILSLLFGLAAAAYAFLPQFRFDQVEITGMDKISKDEVVYFTGARGKPVFTVSPEAIRQTLLLHYPDIYDANVTIDFPAVMNIALQERIPVVEWDFGGSRFWIDRDGTVLNESNSREETIHVFADAYPGSLDQTDRNIPASFSLDVLKTIRTMGKHVPEGKPLIYTFSNGYGWDTDEGWRVFFGKTDSDMEEKLRMQESLTKYFLDNEIQPVLLSLEFKDAPYYRFSER